MKAYKSQSVPSGLQVKVSKHGSPRIAQLLKNTVFGTEGKLQYRQHDIVERMRTQANLQFIEILKAQRVLGTVGMARRPVWHGEDYMNTLYVRYLSIAQQFKRKTGTVNPNRNKPSDKKGLLRELIGNEITHHFEAPFHEKDLKGAFYAYVESANSNSRNLCLSMGFKPVRKVETLLFSRFNPKQNKQIQNAGVNAQDEIKKQLKEFYKDYSFYFEDRIFNTGFYLIYHEKGEIIGGIRAVPVHWQLVDYPGFEGWLMRDFLPFLPFTNRLFEPNAFKFLAFDYAWHKPGKAHILPELMSHCCSLFDINVGMIWGDTRSGLINNLKAGAQLGFLNSVIGSVYADLMVRPINFDLTDPVLQENEKPDSGDSGDSGEESDLNENENQETSEKEEVNSADSEESEDEKVLPVNEELERWKKVMNRPVYVSALDMT
jgi:hypothetical protein